MIQDGKPRPLDTDSHTTAPDGQPMEAQPKWRQDFPVDTARDEYVSRRDFTRFVVLTSAALTVGQLSIVVNARSAASRKETPPERAIAKRDELPVGGAKTFTYPEGSTPRLLVRTGPETFVAYDQACTHLMCPVVPVLERAQLHCPCHNGWFDLHTGQPLAGPPRRALPRVTLELRGDVVFATGLEESLA